MINYSMTKNPQPTQAPEIRNTNFIEVHKGYTPQEAVAEAMRCLNCRKHPCMDGCPTSQRIPEFIACVAHGDFESAWDIIRTRSCMPAVCGRVCPQERQCEGNCVRAIRGEAVGIGALESFVADWHAKQIAADDTEESEEEIAAAMAEPTVAQALAEGKKAVAIIGAGPAGLACADSLTEMGYAVRVYDAAERPGGVLTYGIPQFRLPYTIVEDMVKKLHEAGVEFVNGTFIGRDVTIDDLFAEGFDAVFVGIGAEKRNTLDIPNIDAPGVVSAYDYLAHVNGLVVGHKEEDDPGMMGKHVIIVGAGNVSMDASRTAKRMGAEDVTIVYRRSVSDSTATQEEMAEAKEEGVTLREYVAPNAIIVNEDGHVRGIECIKTVPGKFDDSGRRSPVPVPGSEFIIPADLIILALGAKPEGSVFGDEKAKMMSARGNVAANASGETNREGVFAGGDAVIGAATVVKAMNGGRAAAASIDEYIKEKYNG